MRDKEVRKKYIGDLRLRLVIMVTAMSRFPKTVDTYMIRNIAESIFRRSGFFGMPKRMNSVTLFLFSIYCGSV